MKGKNTGSSELAREYGEFFERMELMVVNGVRSFVGRMLEECEEKWEKIMENKENGRRLSLEERLIRDSESGLNELYEALHSGYLIIGDIMPGFTLREYERQKEEIEREGLRCFVDGGVEVFWKKKGNDDYDEFYWWSKEKYSEMLEELFLFFELDEDFEVNEDFAAFAAFEEGLYKLYGETYNMLETMRLSGDVSRSWNNEELMTAEMKSREDAEVDVEIGGHSVVFCYFLECLAKRKEDHHYPMYAFLDDNRVLSVMIVLLRGMIKEGKMWPMDIVEEGKKAIGDEESLEGLFGEDCAEKIRSLGYVEVTKVEGKIRLKWLPGVVVDENGVETVQATREWAYFCKKLLDCMPEDKKKNKNKKKKMTRPQLSLRFGYDKDKLKHVMWENQHGETENAEAVNNWAKVEDLTKIEDEIRKVFMNRT